MDFAFFPAFAHPRHLSQSSLMIETVLTETLRAGFKFGLMTNMKQNSLLRLPLHKHKKKNESSPLCVYSITSLEDGIYSMKHHPMFTETQKRTRHTIFAPKGRIS
jgi:hypothetical protein